MIDEIKITKERILELIPKFFEEVLKSDYSNPIKEAVEESLKEKDGEIKKMVNEVITEVLATKEFKDQITTKVVGEIIRKGLRD